MFKVASTNDMNLKSLGLADGYVYEYPVHDISRYQNRTSAIKTAETQELFSAIKGIAGFGVNPKIAEEAQNIVNDWIRTHVTLKSILNKILPPVHVDPIANRMIKDDNYDIFKRQVFIQETRESWRKLGAKAIASPIVPTSGAPIIYTGNVAYITYPVRSTKPFQKTDSELATYIGLDLVSYFGEREAEQIAIQKDFDWFRMAFNAVNVQNQNNGYDRILVDSATQLDPSHFVKLEKIFVKNAIPLGFFVMNESTWKEVENWGEGIVGKDVISDILVNGIKFTSIHGVPVVVTKNNAIVPEGIIWAFAVPKYLGLHESLDESRFVITVKGGETKEYQTFENSGMLLANSLGVAVLGYGSNWTEVNDIVTYYTKKMPQLTGYESEGKSSIDSASNQQESA